MSAEVIVDDSLLAEVKALRAEVAELSAALAPVVALVTPLLGAAEQLANMGPLARARAANGILGALTTD